MILHSTYQAACMLVLVNRREPNETSYEALQVLKVVLKTKDIRWKAAGILTWLHTSYEIWFDMSIGQYLQILEAKEVMYDPWITSIDITMFGFVVLYCRIML